VAYLLTRWSASRLPADEDRLEIRRYDLVSVNAGCHARYPQLCFLHACRTPADEDRLEIRQETEAQDDIINRIGDAVQSLHAMSKASGRAEGARDNGGRGAGMRCSRCTP